MNMTGSVTYACGCSDSWTGTDHDHLPGAGSDHDCPTHGPTTVLKAIRRSK